MKHLNKVISIINSCRTQEQYYTAYDWVHRLYDLHNTSRKQRYEINEAFISVGKRLIDEK